MRKIKEKWGFIMEKIIRKIYPFLQKASKIVQVIIYNINIRIFKCDERRILIASKTKDELQGNLLYIYKELQKYDYNVNILLINRANFLKKIQYNFKLLYHVATSKYILIDDFFPLMYILKIRENSKFIQVWHALGAYKRVGYSRKDVGNESSLTHKNYTDTIVSSDSIVHNYAEAFGIEEDKVHPIGIPRTDLFFDNVAIENARKKIYETYPILQNRRVILFAPTFRGRGRKSAHYPEEYIDLDKIYQILNENDIFIIKLHPFIKNKILIKKEYQDKIIDLTNYPDINEILLITDLLITDYSSVIFEYAFMEKPVIFYVPDLEEYSTSRSFYYHYEEYMYGTVAKNQDELMKSMQCAIIVEQEKLEKFKEKFLNRCDGNSSKRFVEELILR